MLAYGLYHAPKSAKKSVSGVVNRSKNCTAATAKTCILAYGQVRCRDQPELSVWNSATTYIVPSELNKISKKCQHTYCRVQKRGFTRSKRVFWPTVMSDVAINPSYLSKIVQLFTYALDVNKCYVLCRTIWATKLTKVRSAQLPIRMNFAETNRAKSRESGHNCNHLNQQQSKYCKWFHSNKVIPSMDVPR